MDNSDISCILILFDNGDTYVYNNLKYTAEFLEDKTTKTSIIKIDTLNYVENTALDNRRCYKCVLKGFENKHILQITSDLSKLIYLIRYEDSRRNNEIRIKVINNSSKLIDKLVDDVHNLILEKNTILPDNFDSSFLCIYGVKNNNFLSKLKDKVYSVWDIFTKKRKLKKRRVKFHRQIFVKNNQVDNKNRAFERIMKNKKPNLSPYIDKHNLQYPHLITWNHQTYQIEVINIPQHWLTDESDEFDLDSLIRQNEVNSLLKETTNMLYKKWKKSQDDKTRQKILFKWTEDRADKESWFEIIPDSKNYTFD